MPPDIEPPLSNSLPKVEIKKETASPTRRQSNLDLSPYDLVTGDFWDAGKGDEQFTRNKGLVGLQKRGKTKP